MDLKSVLRTCFVLFLLSRGTAIAAPSTSNCARLDYEISPKQAEASKQSFQRSLSGLYSINSWRQANIMQPYAHIDQLYQVAPKAQLELATLVKEVGMISKTTTVLPDVKSKDRAEAKIASELNGDASKITDLARASIVADNIPELVQAFELIGKESQIVAVKNRFKQPNASGYRDLKVLVELPESKMIAEIQLHLDAISTVKNGDEHAIYEEIQKIERNAADQSRELSEFEVAQINKLRTTSKTLYHNAWQQYLQPNRIAV